MELVDIVEFKSTEEFYIKEMKGIKPNTVRKRDGDIRFALLENFSKGHHSRNLYIKIIDAESPINTFTRLIKDVSIYEGIFVVSWYTMQEIMADRDLQRKLSEDFEMYEDIFKTLNSLKADDRWLDRW